MTSRFDAMATPPVQERKINRSPRMLRKQIQTAHRKNEELRKRIEEQQREILSLRYQIRWRDMKALAKQAC